MAVDYSGIEMVSLNSLITRIYREIWRETCPSLIWSVLPISKALVFSSFWSQIPAFPVNSIFREDLCDFCEWMSTKAHISMKEHGA